MLKALGIAPCDFPAKTDGSSEPGPVSGKRKAALIEEEEEKPIAEISDPEDEDDNRRMSQLEVTLRSCQAELEKIRQARLDRQQGKRVKREPKPVFLPGEIIDLTI